MDARQPPPTADDAATPPVLKNTRAVYRAAQAKLVAARTANLKRLMGPLTARLAKMEAEFAKADRTTDAQAVREFRESLSDRR